MALTIYLPTNARGVVIDRSGNQILQLQRNPQIQHARRWSTPEMQCVSRGKIGHSPALHFCEVELKNDLLDLLDKNEVEWRDNLLELAWTLLDQRKEQPIRNYCAVHVKDSGNLQEDGTDMIGLSRTLERQLSTRCIWHSSLDDDAHEHVVVIDLCSPFQERDRREVFEVISELPAVYIEKIMEVSFFETNRHWKEMQYPYMKLNATLE